MARRRGGSAGSSQRSGFVSSKVSKEEHAHRQVLFDHVHELFETFDIVWARGPHFPWWPSMLFRSWDEVAAAQIPFDPELRKTHRLIKRKSTRAEIEGRSGASSSSSAAAAAAASSSSGAIDASREDPNEVVLVEQCVVCYLDKFNFCVVDLTPQCVCSFSLYYSTFAESIPKQLRSKSSYLVAGFHLAVKHARLLLHQGGEENVKMWNNIASKIKPRQQRLLKEQQRKATSAAVSKKASSSSASKPKPKAKPKQTKEQPVHTSSISRRSSRVVPKRIIEPELDNDSAQSNSLRSSSSSPSLSPSPAASATSTPSSVTGGKTTSKKRSRASTAAAAAASSGSNSSASVAASKSKVSSSRSDRRHTGPTVLSAEVIELEEETEEGEMPDVMVIERPVTKKKQRGVKRFAASVSVLAVASATIKPTVESKACSKKGKVASAPRKRPSSSHKKRKTAHATESPGQAIEVPKALELASTTEVEAGDQVNVVVEPKLNSSDELKPIKRLESVSKPLSSIWMVTSGQKAVKTEDNDVAVGENKENPNDSAPTDAIVVPTMPYKNAVVWNGDMFVDLEDLTSHGTKDDASGDKEKAAKESSENSGAYKGVVGKRQMRSVLQSQLRQNLANGNLDPHTMVQCETYREDTSMADPSSGSSGRSSRYTMTSSLAAPFQVRVHPDAAFVCDLHAHLATCEIIGFLGGKWDAGSKTLYIQAAFPCRSLVIAGDDGSTDVEMDPESEIELREIIENADLDVVGWYHSHPMFAPDPSIRDIENQASYQQLFQLRHQHTNALSPKAHPARSPPTEMIKQESRSGSGSNVVTTEPFVGLIVGTYDPQRDKAASLFRYFHVKGEQVGLARREVFLPFELRVQVRYFRTISQQIPAERTMYPSVANALGFANDDDGSMISRSALRREERPAAPRDNGNQSMTEPHQVKDKERSMADTAATEKAKSKDVTPKPIAAPSRRKRSKRSNSEGTPDVLYSTAKDGNKPTNKPRVESSALNDDDEQATESSRNRRSTKGVVVKVDSGITEEIPVLTSKHNAPTQQQTLVKQDICHCEGTGVQPSHEVPKVIVKQEPQDQDTSAESASKSSSKRNSRSSRGTVATLMNEESMKMAMERLRMEKQETSSNVCQPLDIKAETKEQTPAPSTSDENAQVGSVSTTKLQGKQGPVVNPSHVLVKRERLDVDEPVVRSINTAVVKSQASVGSIQQDEPKGAKHTAIGPDGEQRSIKECVKATIKTSTGSNAELEHAEPKVSAKKTLTEPEESKPQPVAEQPSMPKVLGVVESKSEVAKPSTTSPNESMHQPVPEHTSVSDDLNGAESKCEVVEPLTTSPNESKQQQAAEHTSVPEALSVAESKSEVANPMITSLKPSTSDGALTPEPKAEPKSGGEATPEPEKSSKSPKVSSENTPKPQIPRRSPIESSGGRRRRKPAQPTKRKTTYHQPGNQVGKLIPSAFSVTGPVFLPGTSHVPEPKSPLAPSDGGGRTFDPNNSVVADNVQPELLVKESVESSNASPVQQSEGDDEPAGPSSSTSNDALEERPGQRCPRDQQADTTVSNTQSEEEPAPHCGDEESAEAASTSKVSSEKKPCQHSNESNEPVGTVAAVFTEEPAATGSCDRQDQVRLNGDEKDADSTIKGPAFDTHITTKQTQVMETPMGLVPCRVVDAVSLDSPIVKPPLEEAMDLAFLSDGEGTMDRSRDETGGTEEPAIESIDESALHEPRTTEGEAQSLTVVDDDVVMTSNPENLLDDAFSSDGGTMSMPSGHTSDATTVSPERDEEQKHDERAQSIQLPESNGALERPEKTVAPACAHHAEVIATEIVDDSEDEMVEVIEVNDTEPMNVEFCSQGSATVHQRQDQARSETGRELARISEDSVGPESSELVEPCREAPTSDEAHKEFAGCSVQEKEEKEAANDMMELEKIHHHPSESEHDQEPSDDSVGEKPVKKSSGDMDQEKLKQAHRREQQRLLERLIEAVRKPEPESLIRLHADNPMVVLETVRPILEKAKITRRLEAAAAGASGVTSSSARGATDGQPTGSTAVKAKETPSSQPDDHIDLTQDPTGSSGKTTPTKQPQRRRSSTLRKPVVLDAEPRVRLMALRKQLLTGLRTKYGVGVGCCAEQAITLIDYYRDFDRRVELHETWKPGISKCHKMQLSLRDKVQQLNLPSKLHDSFVQDLMEYLNVSWQLSSAQTISTTTTTTAT